MKSLLVSLLAGEIPSSICSSHPRVLLGTFPTDLELDDNGYPSEEVVDEIALVSLTDATRWMLEVFPRWLRALPYAKVEVEDTDRYREIRVSTGGWSGVESVVWAVLEHSTMRRFLYEEQRGGHYVFRVPL